MIEIRWDSKKCAAPQECRVCLDTCPQGVFRILPRDGRKKGKATENWAIGTIFLSLCTACGICSDLCPKQAIMVEAAP
jgi:formate hydrogenlyase subunit 6/NADH:ubiquinone oxidoreductase subunit I